MMGDWGMRVVNTEASGLRLRRRPRNEWMDDARQSLGRSYIQWMKQDSEKDRREW